MKKFMKIMDIIFLIAIILSLFELIFIQGMFTWIISFILACVFGLVELILCVIRKEYYKAILVTLLVFSICTNYLALI